MANDERRALTQAVWFLVAGVETDGQCKVFDSMGCSLFQGYFFSRLLPPGELEHYLRASRVESVES